MVENLSQHLENLTELALGDSEVVVVWLYGSHADGTASDHSDVDLAVAYASYVADPVRRRLRPELTALDWVQALGLSERELSVVDIRQAPIPLAFSVIEQGRVLLSKDDGRRMFEEQRIMSMWEDHQYQYQRYG
jgi:predicted nucleotidyltransferase